VVEWLMAPDCKSGLFGVRWFKSIPAHTKGKAMGTKDKIEIKFSIDENLRKVMLGSTLIIAITVVIVVVITI
jgi:hypothetical protein